MMRLLSRPGEGRRGVSRWFTAASMAWLFIIALGWLMGKRMLIYNTSPSVPVGLYRCQPNAEIRVGVLVDFPIPSAAP